jgi:hypothetical protein
MNNNKKGGFRPLYIQILSLFWYIIEIKRYDYFAMAFLSGV